MSKAERGDGALKCSPRYFLRRFLRRRGLRPSHFFDWEAFTTARRALGAAVGMQIACAGREEAARIGGAAHRTTTAIHPGLARRGRQIAVEVLGALVAALTVLAKRHANLAAVEPAPATVREVVLEIDAFAGRGRWQRRSSGHWRMCETGRMWQRRTRHRPSRRSRRRGRCMPQRWASPRRRRGRTTCRAGRSRCPRGRRRRCAWRPARCSRAGYRQGNTPHCTRYARPDNRSRPDRDSDWVFSCSAVSACTSWR